MIASSAGLDAHDDDLPLEDHHPLTVNSPLRLQVEANFISFLSGQLKRKVPDYPDNTYDMFVIHRVGRIYARWFQQVAVFPGMTVEIFSEAFLDCPQSLFPHLYPDRDFEQHMDNLAALFRENSGKNRSYRPPAISGVDEIEKGSSVTYYKVQQVLTAVQS